ncbi:MAG: hypothetical protein A2018_06725 [Alphaproteobacteria bacterium GWF2_58_20]|nr:MAG: hypothetical protein A2018_06725 [Alphaproteobacteria bacterium GWF2_58_20]
MKRIDTGYRPRPLQARLHRGLRRFNVLVAHRRFGKTVFCINHLIHAALTCPHARPFFGYVAPFRNQAKSIAWDYLKSYTRALPGVKYNESELRCELPGNRNIQLFGADNADALRGLYLDGVVMDEYAQMNPRVWPEIIRPMLADRMGWAIFIGTPRGRNGFWMLYEKARQGNDWLAATFRASETGVIAAGELAALREGMSEDQYAQELECSFDAAIPGAYYGRLMGQADRDGRIGKVPHDESRLVHTAWDIGVGDATSIWFFQLAAGGWLYVIDYYENTGEGLDHYAAVLREKPYRYGRHIAPHDAAVREWGSGRTRLETAQSMGLRFVMAPRASLEDGINAARMTLPKCRFDEESCHDGIEALRQYQQVWDGGRKCFRNTPLHDWTSHAADAFRYLALGWRAEGGRGTGEKARKGPPTLGDMLKEAGMGNGEKRI